MIYLYNGPGVAQRCLMQVESTIQNIFPTYRTQRISFEDVISGIWKKQAVLFILPGGADLPYVENLQGKGNQQIRSYVEEGGSFLGICAGSYYAGSSIEFALNTNDEVKGKRELAFFPGLVKGPVLASYDYASVSGARAAKLRWADAKGFQQGKQQFTVFYNGGGHFVEASNYDNTSILAHYENTDLAAIIQCSIGLGTAILSGVHFEEDPFLLSNINSRLEPIARKLIPENKDRIDLLKYIFQKLLLSKDSFEIASLY